MPPAPLIVLDLDGTLIDTFPRHHRTYRRIAGEFGLEPLEFDRYRRLRRRGRSNLEVLLRGGLPEEKAEAARALWREWIESGEMLALDRPLAGVIPWLEEWSGVARLVLATVRSREDNLARQLEALDLPRYFERVVVVRHNGDPGGAKAEAVESTAGGGAVAWVGDTEADMRAAARVDARPTGVLTGMRSAGVLRRAGAARVVQSIARIHSWN